MEAAFDPVMFDSFPLTPVPTRIHTRAVTAVELLWRMPMTTPFIPANVVRGTRDVAAIARVLEDDASSTRSTALRLQQEVCRAFDASDALVLWIDWGHRIVHSTAGRPIFDVEELVLEVAGCGRRALVDNAIVLPLGAPPARAVLAMRKPKGQTFGASEQAALGTLAISIAPMFDRLR